MNDSSLPVGSPALHFLAGQVSVGDLGSENEAVLVVAGVWQRERFTGQADRGYQRACIA